MITEVKFLSEDKVESIVLHTDKITIFGLDYSYEILREWASGSATGKRFEIVAIENGSLTLKRVQE